MTSESVRQLIELEIAGNWSLTNAHGCDLRRCLVMPELREYNDCGGARAGQSDEIIQLWLVLEELPVDHSGYKIVYGEESGRFGLAVPGSERDVFIGYYGGFLDAYRSM
jgi:hypothetical protein